MLYDNGNISFLTYFKAFDFTERSNLNFIFGSIFERISIKDLLVDFLMCLCTSVIALKMFKFSLSGLILINLQCNSFSIEA